MAKKAHSTIVVFTEAAIPQIAAAGGLGDWVLNPDKAAGYKYLVCCRKSRWNNREEGVPNRAAFLVATIKRLVPGIANARGQRRYFIEIGEFAPLKKPDVWGAWRNPVRYTFLEDLGIKLESLRMQPIAAGASEAVDPGKGADSPHALSVAQAKNALATTFGVRPEDIEISVRFPASRSPKAAG